MVNKMCSSLMYELGEFCSALQKFDSAKNAESQKPNLYVSSPSHVWDPTTLVGKIKTLLDRLWKWITSNSYRGNVHEAVENIIHDLFDRVVLEGYKARQSHLAYNILLIESHFQLESNELVRNEQKRRYYRHLESELEHSKSNLSILAGNFYSALEEGSLNGPSLDKLRQIVTNVCHAVKPFWQKMLYSRPTFGLALNAYLPEHPCKPEIGKSIDWAINDLALYRALSEEQEWIDLESKLPPIPVIELIKICGNADLLSANERKRLDDWIKELNGLSLNRKSINGVSAVNLLRNVLKGIVCAASIQGHFQISEGLLINKLDDYGCKLMRLEDRNQIAWRSQLKKGKEIVCDGVKYQLGEELKTDNASGNEFGYLSEKRDRWRIFKLDSHPDLILKIGSSPFDLAIASHQFANYHVAIPPIKGMNEIKETGDKRQVAFVEQIPTRLSDCSWSSSQSRLTPEDEKILSRVASFLFCMCDWKKWPQGLNPKRLGLNIDSILTSLDPLAEGVDDYLAAEKFCIDIACNKDINSLHVLSYLMEVSDYSRHPMAEFYRSSVKVMLETGDFDFLNLSLEYGFDKAEYKAKMRELLLQANLLRNKCMNQACGLFSQKEAPFQEKKAELLRAKKALKSEKLLINKESGKDCQLKKRMLKNELEKIKIEQEKYDLSVQRTLFLYMNRWEHFEKEKKKLVQALSENEKALEANRKNLKKANGDQKGYLKELKRELKLGLKEIKNEIISLTALDRLLQVYLSLPTAAWLPDLLSEKVLSSFDSPEGSQKTILDRSYYQEQQKLILDKNKYAVSLMQKAG